MKRIIDTESSASGLRTPYLEIETVIITKVEEKMFLRARIDGEEKAKVDDSLRTIIESFDKSILNMIEFYSDALMGFLEGRASLDEIPRGNRKRFVEYGVLRKFGARYEITEVGEILIRRTHSLI